MRHASKKEFLAATEKQWRLLWEQVEQIPQSRLTRRIRSETDRGLAWSPKDVLAHLHGWHRLFLQWYRATDETRSLPAAGYNWRELPALNREIHEQFDSVSFASVRRRTKLSHGRIIKIVEGLSDRRLREPGHFKWTGKSSLLSYIAPNTESHYRWAIRKLKKITR